MVILMCCSLLFVVEGGGSSQSQLPGCRVLRRASGDKSQSDPEIRMRWGIDESGKKISIRVEAVGPRIEGYLGVGISSSKLGFFIGLSDVFISIPPSQYV